MNRKTLDRSYLGKGLNPSHGPLPADVEPVRNAVADINRAKLTAFAQISETVWRIHTFRTRTCDSLWMGEPRERFDLHWMRVSGVFLELGYSVKISTTCLTGEVLMLMRLRL